jgi:serine/threonine protein kinase
MRKYRLVAKKGEGTFSEVLKAQNVKDGKYHAIKCMKNRFESIDQVRLFYLKNIFVDFSNHIYRLII